MTQHRFPVIDPIATGRNILSLRKKRGLSVRDLQEWFNFEEPRAIYKWQAGKTLPSIDNLFALSEILEVPVETIVVRRSFPFEPHTEVCGPVFFVHISVFDAGQSFPVDICRRKRYYKISKKTQNGRAK